MRLSTRPQPRHPITPGALCGVLLLSLWASPAMAAGAERHVTLRCASGRYLQSAPNGKVSCGASSVRARWTLITEAKRRRASLRDHRGRYLSMRASGVLFAEAASRGASETFFIERRGASASFRTSRGDYITEVSSADVRVRAKLRKGLPKRTFTLTHTTLDTSPAARISGKGLLKTFDGRYLAWNAQGHLSLTRTPARKRSVASFVKNSDGTIAIFTMSGWPIMVDPNGAAYGKKRSVGVWERFRVVDSRRGGPLTVFLRGPHGKYLTVTSGGSLRATSQSKGVRERFTIVPR